MVLLLNLCYYVPTLFLLTLYPLSPLKTKSGKEQKQLTSSPLGNQLIDNVIFFLRTLRKKKLTNSGPHIEHYITKGSHLEQGETFLLQTIFTAFTLTTTVNNMKCQSVTFLQLGTCGTCVVDNLYDTLMSKNATRNYQQNILIKY